MLHRLSRRRHSRHHTQRSSFCLADAPWSLPLTAIAKEGLPHGATLPSGVKGGGMEAIWAALLRGSPLEPECAVHPVPQGPRRIASVSAYQVSAKSWRHAGVARGTVSSVDWRR